MFDDVPLAKMRALVDAEDALGKAQVALERMRLASLALMPAVGWNGERYVTEQEAKASQASFYAKEERSVKLALDKRNDCLKAAGITPEDWKRFVEEALGK